jgi:hypothetical protein
MFMALSLWKILSLDGDHWEYGPVSAVDAAAAIKEL